MSLFPDLFEGREIIFEHVWRGCVQPRVAQISAGANLDVFTIESR